MKFYIFRSEKETFYIVSSEMIHIYFIEIWEGNILLESIYDLSAKSNNFCILSSKCLIDIMSSAKYSST